MQDDSTREVPGGWPAIDRDRVKPCLAERAIICFSRAAANEAYRTAIGASMSTSPYDAATVDDRRMWDLWLSGVHQPTIVAADEAGIFTALADAPATVSELAARLNFDERATRIVVRLLAALGLVTLRLERFHLTDEARTYLVSSSPWYWGPMLHVAVSEWHKNTVLAKLRRLGSDRPAAIPG